MLQSATQMNATKRIEGSMTFGGWVVRGAGRAALALLVAAPAAAQQETTAGVRSYTEARAVLDRGIAAVGGLESVRALENIQVDLEGEGFARNQSARPEAPYDRNT